MTPWTAPTPSVPLRATVVVPGSKSAMTAYVAAVDHARAYLDVLMKKAIGALQGVGGNAG